MIEYWHLESFSRAILHICKNGKVWFLHSSAICFWVGIKMLTCALFLCFFLFAAMLIAASAVPFQQVMWFFFLLFFFLFSSISLIHVILQGCAPEITVSHIYNGSYLIDITSAGMESKCSHNGRRAVQLCAAFKLKLEVEVHADLTFHGWNTNHPTIHHSGNTKDCLMSCFCCVCCYCFMCYGR